jgi:oligopeptide transport system substrate-binding protein
VNCRFRWLIVVLFCLILVGCGRDDSRKERKTLVFCSDVDVTNINPYAASNLSEPSIIEALFEGLVAPDPATYQPLPGVADRWSISENGKIYEFHLRDNARWSNGDMIVAEDFVFTVNRALSLKPSSPSVELFFPIRNAEKFYRRQIKNFNEVGIHAIGKHTLRIELERPLNSFIYIVMQPCWYPLNEEVCESISRYNDWNDFFFNIISNGPFMVIDRKANDSVILEKNPYYWDYEAVKLDEIKFIVGSNIIQSFNEFRNGAINICAYNPQNSHYSSDLIDKDCIKSEIHFGCFYLLLNTKKKPLDDKRVRRALAIAIRRKALLDLLSMEEVSAAYGLIPTFEPDYKASNMFEENPVRAQELLAVAGYNNGEDFPKIQLICSGSKWQNIVCTFIKDELKNALNIEVNIDYVKRDEFLAMRREGNFDICCGDWYGDYPDPERFLRLFSGKDQRDYYGWHSDEYDKLLDVAYYVRDDRERFMLLKDAERLLMECMPVIPLYFDSSLYLIRKNIKGWDSGLLIHQWKIIDVEKQ